MKFFVAGTNATNSQQVADYWDDDWDDDSEVGQTNAYAVPVHQQSNLQSNYSSNNEYGDSVSMHTVHSVIPDKSVSSVPKKNNKFGALVKSSEEGFLLCSKEVIVPEDEKIYIEEVESGRFVWLPTGESYSCVVTSPKKESKLGGLKSFIVYQLTPTVRVNYHQCKFMLLTYFHSYLLNILVQQHSSF